MMQNMDKHNSKQAILDAAEEEFLEMGFHGAKTSSIAKRAGVTHAMLHYYFSTKENLYDVFISQKLQEVKNIMFPALLEEGVDFIDRVRTVIDKQFGYIQKHPYLPRFMLNEVLLKPERFNELISNILQYDIEKFAIIQQEIDTASNEGKINFISLPNLIIDILSLNIISQVMAPVVIGVMPGVGFDKNEFIENRKKEIIETITRKRDCKTMQRKKRKLIKNHLP